MGKTGSRKWKLVEKKCAECGKPFMAKLIQLCCSVKCGRKRMTKQLDAITARRRQGKKCCRTCGRVLPHRRSG